MALQEPAVLQEPPVLQDPRISVLAKIELKAHWDPCGPSLYHLLRSVPALAEPKPAQPILAYDAEDFRPFLPQGPVPVGSAWAVPHEASLKILRQLHPGAGADLGPTFGEAPGTWAMLRAAGTDYFEILLRVQTVFQLEAGVVMKPAQFEGRLLITRHEGLLTAFSLALPARDTNVDVNVPMAGAEPDPITGSVPILADIGFVPRMELSGGEFPATTWIAEIPLEDARLALRRAFYPFAALDWMPFEEAVAASRAQSKPLHLVLLFGCLDDDSC